MHVPAKACPALDAGWSSVRRQEHAPAKNAAASRKSGAPREVSMRAFILAVSALCALAAGPATAQSLQGSGPLKIGVLNDMSGVYSDDQGPGSVLAAQMAVEDFGGRVHGQKVEVISGDHQNKPDIGAQVARGWLDNEGVGAIVDAPNSAVALAVGDSARDRNQVMIGSGA